MTVLEWVPDCCPCKIEFDPATNTFVRWLRRCNEHRALDGQALLDGIQAHTRTFTGQFADTDRMTDDERLAEMRRIKVLEQAEKDRIINAGPVEDAVR